MGLDADRVIRSIRQAALLARGSAGRRGMVEILPESAADVVIAGDLHGNLRNLKAILEIARLDEHPGRHLVLQEFVHGTERYPNGGCTSHRLLDVISALKEKYPARIHLILGNHELAQWTGRRVGKDGESLNELFEQGIETAYPGRADDVLEAYEGLFASMLLAVRTASRLFISHSIPERRFLATYDTGLFERFGLREEDLEKSSAAYQLVWGRDVSDETATAFCERVDADFLVTGHIPQPTGFSMPNSRQLILDSVAAPAACALLPARGVLSLETIEQGIRLLPTG